MCLPKIETILASCYCYTENVLLQALLVGESVISWKKYELEVDGSCIAANEMIAIS